ncbi:MAG: M23 family metallopeptidase [Desulfuromonadaceae bacterium]|nr:M23 family metallopeptidase [Desulfuromonadaceae bacterium]
MRSELKKRRICNKLLAVPLCIFLSLLVAGSALASAWNSPTVQLTPAVLAPGDVTLLSVIPADRVSSASILWQKEHIPLMRLAEKDALGAFLAIPRDERAGSKEIALTLVRADGEQFKRNLTLEVKSKEFPVQRLSLPEEKVTLAEKDLARHQREKTAVQNALAQPFAERLWQASFQRPVPGAISTPFGVGRILNDKPRNSHSGVDLRGKTGDPVAAASDGIVILTGEHFFAGKSVYIDHGMGLITMYFHLSGILVEKGERVRAGQTIGLLGSTGRSTGPHLHWGLRVHNQPADPLTLLTLFPLL